MLKTTAVLTGLAGSPYYSTLFWAGTDQPDAQVAQDAHQAYLTVLASLYTTQMTAQVDTEVTSINPANGQAIDTFSFSPRAPVPGTANPTVLPHSVQGLVQLRTGQFQAGRQVRGKLFIPGLTINTLDTTDGGMYQVVATQLATDLNTVFQAVPLLVWSRKAGVAYPVIECTVAKKFAVLRSRRD